MSGKLRKVESERDQMRNSREEDRWCYLRNSRENEACERGEECRRPSSSEKSRWWAPQTPDKWLGWTWRPVFMNLSLYPFSYVERHRRSEKIWADRVHWLATWQIEGTQPIVRANNLPLFFFFFFLNLNQNSKE